MYVYACVYAPSGDFLLATKRVLGHFYGNGRDDGKIYKEGVKVNPKKVGAIRYALPGGTKEENETIIEGAHREWSEETNCSILDAKPSRKEWLDEGFSAGYFELPLERIEEIRDRMDIDVLDAAEIAVARIKDGSITTYGGIYGSLPNAPADNELEAMTVWSVHTDWSRIKQWQGDPNVGWFYTILLHLKTLIPNPQQSHRT